MRALFIGFLLLASTQVLRAETIQTKYCGSFDTFLFDCNDVTRSSFIKRLCYDLKHNLLLLKLNDVWYCKCDLERGKLETFTSASSMGRYFNGQLKGKFRCVGIDSRFPK